jgi:DNA-binding transcriptional LysR family regulator
MHLEVRDLVLLDALAEAEALQQAASRLGVSRSAISHHLNSLERRFGVALWLRRGRPGPTDEARRLAVRARATLRACAEAEKELGLLIVRE